MKSAYALATRLDTARTVRDLGVKLRSLEELEGRPLDLEDRVKQLPPRR